MSYSVTPVVVSGYGSMFDAIVDAATSPLDAGKAAVEAGISAGKGFVDAGGKVLEQGKSAIETGASAVTKVASLPFEAAKAAGSGAMWVAGKAIGAASPLAALVVGPVGLIIPDSIKGPIENGVSNFADKLSKGDVAGAASSVGTAAWETAKSGAPYLQAGVAFVPGIGPEAAAGLAIGMSLAQGGNISDALIAGARAAIPGGALAQGAFDTGVNLAHGQSLTDAGFNAAMNQAPLKGNPAAQAAARAGYSIAKGKNVQSAIGQEGTRLLMESAVGPLKAAAAPLTQALAQANAIPAAAIATARSRLSATQKDWFDRARKAANDAKRAALAKNPLKGFGADTWGFPTSSGTTSTWQQGAAAASPFAKPSSALVANALVANVIAPLKRVSPEEAAQAALIQQAKATGDPAILDAVKLGSVAGNADVLVAQKSAFNLKRVASLLPPATSYTALYVVGGLALAASAGYYFYSRKKRA